MEESSNFEKLFCSMIHKHDFQFVFMQWTCDLRKHKIGTHQFFFLRVILEVMLDLNYYLLRRPNKLLAQNPKIKILLRKQTLCFPRLSLRSSIRPFRPEMIPEIWKFQRFSLFLSISGKFYLSCLPRLVEKMWGVKEASLNVIIDIITVTIRILIINIIVSIITKSPMPGGGGSSG